MSKSNCNIGIMTYHAAYNFGSVLQAFATQQLMNGLGFKNEIINYRLPNQKDYYGSFFALRFGKRDCLRRILCWSQLTDRLKRKKKYEAFITNNLVLRDGEINSFPELSNIQFDYDTLVSGSDQVWNIHCNAEFQTEPPESILGYYLDFGRPDARRIAFSSSIGSMTREEMSGYKNLLNRYQHIAVREAESAGLLSDLLGKEIFNTVDPTLTLNKEQWLSVASNTTKYKFDNYLLIYSLKKGTRTFIRFLQAIKKFADRNDLKVICLSPFLAVPYPGIYMDNSCGPLEFISYISRAKLVVTDTFHGTAFSVNLETPFYSVNDGSDRRKLQLLEKVKLKNRSITNINQLNDIGDFSCSFDESAIILEKEREAAKEYLRMVLA